MVKQVEPQEPKNCDNVITFPLYEETSVALEITRKKTDLSCKWLGPHNTRGVWKT